jgi:ATP-binding cassette subfamily B protein RaxB
MNIQLQTEASECGLACLAMASSHFGCNIDLADLRRRFSISLKGATLGQLVRHADAMNLATRPLRVELEELGQLKLPCILHWDLNHFVVLTRIKTGWHGRTRLTIADPAVGEYQMDLDVFSKHFTGVALELTPTSSFQQKDERKKISIGELTGHIVGLRRAIFQAIALAFALEVFVVTAPLFNQFIIDEVIVSGDQELLSVLAVGFALLMITQTAIGLARSWFLMRWSMDVSFQWSARVFSHLIRLPVTFFEKRHLGDVVSRFDSIGIIQSTLTSLWVESALDGLMAVLALTLMLIYSIKLSILVVVTLVLYAFLRWAFYHTFKEATQERLVLAAKESSHFLETLRAISPLKLFGRENERRARWLNLKADVQNRDIRTQKMAVLFKVASTAIFGGQSIAVFYLGANEVMQNALTVGMLMAFASYSTTFSGRFFRLIDLMVDVKILSLHCERLADIVLEKAEDDVATEVDFAHVLPTITLKNIKFRYAEGEPMVLNGINLSIPAGQSIALVGPSGCGKTTLCKIILGLLKPTEGEIFIGHMPISQLGHRAYRQLIGSVMQDDVLLAGSIHDNINFFDSIPNLDLVERSSMQAAIHETISKMPMGYQTLVGDLGSSLSGGQKQRILLARALYKQPKILVLDEATSHLDVGNERLVSAALSSLNLTRIMIAHRPETIATADRVVSLNEGMLVETQATRKGTLHPDYQTA